MDEVFEQLDMEEEYEEADELATDDSVASELVETGRDVAWSGDMYGHPGQYEEMYDAVRDELADVTFGEADLREFVLQRPDMQGQTEGGKKLWGLYSSALLGLLDERNEGRTRFYVNGGGARFDYLFFGARDFDELYVENFEGDGIGKYVAYGDDAEVDLVALKGIRGDETAAYVAANHVDAETGGQVGLVVGTGIYGDDAGCMLGAQRGHIDAVVFADMQGDNLFHGVGSNEGHVENLVLTDVETERMGDGAASFNGYLGSVFLYDHEKFYLGAQTAFEKEYGEIERVVYDDGRHVGGFRIVDPSTEWMVENPEELTREKRREKEELGIGFDVPNFVDIELYRETIDAVEELSRAHVRELPGLATTAVDGAHGDLLSRTKRRLKGVIRSL